MERNPGKIVLRSAETIGAGRSEVTTESLDKWFDECLEYFTEIGHSDILLDSEGRRLFNLDETFFLVNPKDDKVIAPYAAKHVYQVRRGGDDKNGITVSECFNAAGEFVRPFLVFPCKRVRASVDWEGYDEAVYAASDNGWMTSELMVENIEFIRQFVEEAEPEIQFPVGLLFDGAMQHLTFEVAMACKLPADKEIIPYCFLENATHIYQPADVGFFFPVKASYKKKSKKYKMEHEGVGPTKRTFPAVYKEARSEVCNKKIAQAAWKKCGLHPWNKGYDRTKCAPSLVYMRPKPGAAALAYMPTQPSSVTPCPAEHTYAVQSISTSNSQLDSADAAATDTSSGPDAVQSISTNNSQPDSADATASDTSSRPGLDTSVVSLSATPSTSAGNTSTPASTSAVSSEMEQLLLDMDTVDNSIESSVTSPSPQSTIQVDQQTFSIPPEVMPPLKYLSMTPDSSNLMAAPAQGMENVQAKQNGNQQTPTSTPFTKRGTAKQSPPIVDPQKKISPVLSDILNSKIPNLTPRRRAPARPPKALTGVQAMAFFRRRKEEKENAERMKQERKLERERKKKEREEEKQRKAEERKRKAEERAALKAQKEKEKAAKRKVKGRQQGSQAKKAKVDGKKAESQNSKVQEDESGAEDTDDEYKEILEQNTCPKCKSRDEAGMIQCDICDQWWHSACTIEFKDISEEDLEDEDFYCELCITK